MKKSLHPEQIAVRKKLIQVIPNEQDRLTWCIAVCKNASFLATYITQISDFVQIPEPIQYQVALVLNSCLAIWGDVKVEEAVIADFKVVLDKSDVDYRFQQVFGYLYSVAKEKGWV